MHAYLGFCGEYSKVLRMSRKEEKGRAEEMALVVVLHIMRVRSRIERVIQSAAEEA